MSVTDYQPKELETIMSTTVKEREQFGKTGNATIKLLEHLTLQINNAIFEKDFFNPIILNNVALKFWYRCNPTLPPTYTRSEFLAYLATIPLEYPSWKAKTLSVSMLQFDGRYAEVLILQEVSGVPAAGHSYQISTIWKWKLVTGRVAGGEWKAFETTSVPHPLPADIDLMSAGED